MNKVISIDPGHEKCGLLLADIDELKVISGKIVKKSFVMELLTSWMKNYLIDLIVLGNGTTSNYWQIKMQKYQAYPIKLVDEKMTTLRARSRYLELCPPKFPISLFPRSLILPPKNLDSVVSLILIEDYFEKQFEWKGPIEVRTWP